MLYVLKYREVITMHFPSSLSDGMSMLPSIQVHSTEYVDIAQIATGEFMGLIGSPECRSNGRSRGSVYQMKVLYESEHMELM